jgi:hypothetical protein
MKNILYKPYTTPFLLSLSVCLLLGCEAPVEVGTGCDALVGDVVISEIMANPNGADSDGEWFEIYNAASRPLILDRLEIRRLSYNSEGGIEVKQHYLRGLGSLDANAYFVLGDGVVGVEPIDYDYDPEEGLSNESFGAMGNTKGGIAIACGGALIDEVWYGTEDGLPEPTEGRSLSLEGDVAPDALLNDSATYWCEGVTEYSDGNFGSPGSANTACGFVSCNGDNGARDINEPSVGDLVISEVLINPDGTDNNKEWIEIYIAAEQPVDLNRLIITSTRPDGSDVDTAEVGGVACVQGNPGDYLVIGASADTTLNGNLVVDAVAPGLAFFNDAQAPIEITRRGQLLDRVVLGEPEAGRSWSLDGGMLTHDGNDLPGAFCSSPLDANTAFDGVGTPGSANALCGTVSCMDSDGVRPVSFPAVGDLIVSEILIDPSSTDGGKEWIEVYVASEQGVDLNGLTITNVKMDTGSSKDFTLASETCLRAASGSYVVVGALADSAANGGITPLAVDESLSFLNDSELRIEVALGETLIDFAMVPDTASGRSASLQPNQLSADGNDVSTAFCESQTSGSYEGYGTPGAANLCGASCVGTDGPRSMTLPDVGEVVISEVFANPDGSDAGRDWIEFYNASDVALDLNGLTIEAHKTTGSMADETIENDTCVSVAPGEYVVIGGQGAAAEGVPTAATIGSATATLFYVSDLTMKLVNADGTIIDETAGPFDPTSGASYSLDPAQLDATANNDLNNWCVATESVPAELPFLGTPGAVNTICGE